MDDQFWLPFFSEHDADLLIPDFPDSWIPEITWTKPEIAESEARVVVATVLPLPQQLSQLSQIPQIPQIPQLSQIPQFSLDDRLKTAAKRARECISFATADECQKLQMGLEMFVSRVNIRTEQSSMGLEMFVSRVNIRTEQSSIDDDDDTFNPRVVNFRKKSAVPNKAAAATRWDWNKAKKPACTFFFFDACGISGPTL